MISPAISHQPRETKLQERRNEENAEGRRLQRVKEKVQELRKVQNFQLARAS